MVAALRWFCTGYRQLLNILFLLSHGCSAGSIPDSYDIYRYLNLVRYSIFDTRYIGRKCNFVYIFRGYLKRLRHKKKSIKKILFSKKKNYETLRGKRNPEFFSRKCDFFRRSDFFPRKSDFFLSKIRIFSKTYEIRGGSFAIYYFSKTYEIGCLVTFRVSLLHRLCRT